MVEWWSLIAVIIICAAVAGETIFGRCYRFEFIPKVRAPRLMRATLKWQGTKTGR